MEIRAQICPYNRDEVNEKDLISGIQMVFMAFMTISSALIIKLLINSLLSYLRETICQLFIEIWTPTTTANNWSTFILYVLSLTTHWQMSCWCVDTLCTDLC